MSDGERAVKSALWAAFGDALGFITELADAPLIKRRTGAAVVSNLTKWKRRIGGRFGIELELPGGCYSDDTQLRLATGRAIREDGTFDVEAFSKVELPIWRAYALGAGRGSKAAAQSLVRSDTQWFCNFFNVKGSRYVDGGGNGAAMRIQPHVWSSKGSRRDSEILLDIYKNAITTHGHMRGIVGAGFHGLCLRWAMREGRLPGPRDWLKFTEMLEWTDRILCDDDHLRTYWVRKWELESKNRIEVAVRGVTEEIRKDLHLLEEVSPNLPDDQWYPAVLDQVGGYSVQQRGSGTKTAIVACVLAKRFESRPLCGIQHAVNALGSDTDTIATMAGALLGAVSDISPPGQIADQDYVASEAWRLSQTGSDSKTRSFSYPDLLYWEPPKTEYDVANGPRSVAGFGAAEPVGEAVLKPSSGEYWQWMRVNFGQTLLLKFRGEAKRNESRQLLLIDEPPALPDSKPNLTPKAKTKRRTSGGHARVLDVAEALESVIASQLDPRVIGAMLIELSKNKDGPEEVVTFAAAVAALVLDSKHPPH